MVADISYRLRNTGRDWRWSLNDANGAVIDIGSAETMALARAQAFTAAIRLVEKLHSTMEATEPTTGPRL